MFGPKLVEGISKACESAPPFLVFRSRRRVRRLCFRDFLKVLRDISLL